MRDVRIGKHRVRGLLLAGALVAWGSLWASALAGTTTLPAGLVEASPPAPMPAFSLPDIHGGTMSSAALQGKVVVIRFWATW
ncbi:MAG: redoxin domain-containing protein [Nitrospinae bacterium]|nr:redoxin domain-containing protein [Nitrospinota bacterium]